MDLMVYSLPDPAKAPVDSAPSGHGKLLMVVFLCMLPMIIAAFVYQFVRPQGRATGGELIQPARAMPALSLAGPDGKRGPLTALQGQWLLLGVSDPVCGDACMRRLYLQRQLRETLGKDRERIDRVWAVQGKGNLGAGVAEQSKAGLTVLIDPDAQLTPWLLVAPGEVVADSLYLVDPLGNLMMRFPASFDSAGAARIRRDLERLLRGSVAWDAPGR